MQVECDTSTEDYWGSSLDRSHLVASQYLIDRVDGKLGRQIYDVTHAPQIVKATGATGVRTRLNRDPFLLRTVQVVKSWSPSDVAKASHCWCPACMQVNNQNVCIGFIYAVYVCCPCCLVLWSVSSMGRRWKTTITLPSQVGTLMKSVGFAKSSRSWKQHEARILVHLGTFRSRPCSHMLTSFIVKMFIDFPYDHLCGHYVWSCM